MWQLFELALALALATLCAVPLFAHRRAERQWLKKLGANPAGSRNGYKSDWA